MESLKKTASLDPENRPPPISHAAAPMDPKKILPIGVGLKPELLIAQAAALKKAPATAAPQQSAPSAGPAAGLGGLLFSGLSERFSKLGPAKREDTVNAGGSVDSTFG